MTLQSLPSDLVLPVLQAPRKAARFYGPDRPPPGKGRKKGVLNRITADLKQGLLRGAANCGYDGAGLGGVDGFLLMCAQKHPKHYLALLGKLIPLNLNPDPAPVATINVIGIESGRFLSKEEIENIQQVEAHTVDHVPSPEHRYEPAPPEPTEASIEAQSPEEEQLLAALKAMTTDELLAKLSNALVSQG
jgi:hypothetical protein